MTIRQITRGFATIALAIAMAAAFCPPARAQQPPPSQRAARNERERGRRKHPRVRHP